MSRAQNIKTLFGFILLMLLSGTFIFSAITKFISIEPFEWTFMDMGLPNTLSFFLARFFIGFEFVMAFFMLAHLYLKKITYPVTLVFLGVMTLYLIIILATKGNNVDCGCFGDTLPMSPLVSIGKNILLVILTLLLLKIYPGQSYPFQWLAALVGGAAIMTVPFLFVPYSQKPTRVNLDALYRNPKDRPATELRQGKHLMAFMSLGCPHCRNAARIFKDIYAQDSTVPIFMVLYGYPSDTADFFADTRAGRVPHFVYHNPKEFQKMAGKFVPNIFWINNGVAERRITYIQLNKDLLRSWNKQ